MTDKNNNKLDEFFNDDLYDELIEAEEQEEEQEDYDEYSEDSDSSDDSDDSDDDDDDLGNIISEATEKNNTDKITHKLKKKEDMKHRAAKKRKEVNTTKKKLGIRKGKQSKFSTRSHSFLSEPLADRVVHIVLNQHRTEIYKDGADIAPRIFMGVPGFGNMSKKNAFEHLITVQDKIRSVRLEVEKEPPNWILISNDTSIILDRNLITYLEDLKHETHVASPYGFQEIRASGKWYDIDGLPAYNLRGCYVQGNIANNDWNFIVGTEYNSRPKSRITIAHGPFIAIRGKTFLDIDFTDMAVNCKSGFFHYMAHISMECAKRGLKVAQIKALSWQYDTITAHRNDPELLHDQSYFTTYWADMLPRNINSQ